MIAIALHDLPGLASRHSLDFMQQLRMDHKIYVSLAPSDLATARQIVEELEKRGFRCWYPERDVAAGEDWGKSISVAIESARVLILLESSASQRSHAVLSDVLKARDRKLPILPVAIERVPFSNELSEKLGGSHVFDVSLGKLSEKIPAIVSALTGFISDQERSVPTPEELSKKPTSKGYVFISYSKPDRHYVEQLKTVLRRRGYAYWDYSESDRNYHGALYRELEEKIEGAAAFICLLTDGWRVSDWPASEYLYAREASIPIFVIQVSHLERPVPIILNHQTRIDCSTDFELGARILESELEKKGL